MVMVTGVPTTNQYVYAASLQQAFIDIRNAQPLSSGTLTFYRDLDHSPSGLKPIYAVGGPPDSPTFTELPNPLSLSLIGTIIDPNNNDEIVPVFKPYDDQGNPDPYYIVITASDGYPQGTRDHFPFVNNQSDNIIVNTQNIIPDGQFLFHQDIPASGLITQDETPLCYGGWVFVRTTGTASVNYVTFPRFDAPIDSPTQNPRYALRVQCTTADPSDSQKDVALIISDSNFMQNQVATYQITAWSNDGNNHNVQIILRKTYGNTFTASPETEQIIEIITVTPEIQDFLVSFTVSDNTGVVLSDNDTDTFQLVLRAPLFAVSDILYENAIFVPTQFASLSYPPTSPEQAKAFALPASYQTPAYDGSDLGKFVKLDYVDSALQTLGFVYDDPTPTGNIEFSGIPIQAPPPGRLYCGGGEIAVENGITIPTYPNLFSKIGYTWGTGLNGLIYSNPSGNTFDIVWARYDVTQAVPDAGTSGFTFTLIQPAVPGTQQQIYQVTTTAGSSISPGAYYRILVNTTSTQFIHLYWFTVNGAGTIPSVTFDASKVINILSTDTAAQIMIKVFDAGYAIYALPDPRGMFPRVWSASTGRDPAAASRGSMRNSPVFPYLGPSGLSGDNVGSTQTPIILDHYHAGPPAENFIYNSGAGTEAFTAVTYTGAPNQVPFVLTPITSVALSFGGAPISETDSAPLNINFNCFIKY